MIDDIRNYVHAPGTRFRVKGKSMIPTLKEGDDVIVTPVKIEDLIPGDIVFIWSGNRTYIHRFLQCNKRGVVTKGDGHRILDPIWDRAAIRGRVVEVWRDNTRIYQRTAKSVDWNRLLAYSHWSAGLLWGILRRLKAWIMAIMILFIPVIVLSAVTLVDFEIDPGQEAIFVYWETASEAGNLGFYLWRSEDEIAGYYKLPVSNPNLHFIPSADEGAGAFYDFVDEEVTPGVLYYYKVQDIPASGADGVFSSPLSGGIGIVTDTPTPTPTDTPTPTATHTLEITSTSTPEPADHYVKFWAENEDVNAGECVTLQWQTDNVKSVFIDGDGVPGLGAKTYCPCEDEYHTLTVYFSDDTRQDYRIDINVTGDCEEIAPTFTLTPTQTPTKPPSRMDATATLTPNISEIRAVNTPTRIAESPTLREEPSLTPTLALTHEKLSPTPFSGEQTERNPYLTPTKAIVEGQLPRKTVFSQPTILLLFAVFVGVILFSLGVWYWKGR